MNSVLVMPLADPVQVNKVVATLEDLLRRNQANLASTLGLIADLIATRPSSIAPLLRTTAELRLQNEARNRGSASNYNLFRLLDRSERELTHDRILADFLDPYGSHGQGAMFLRCFLDMLAQRADGATQEAVDLTATALRALANDLVDMPPPYEWRITRQVDRIDIRVENRNKGILLFIENKINAGEQTDQLRRYLKLLDDQKGRGHGLLILLAPEGYCARTGSPHLQLSYQRDIREWLETAIPHIGAAHVASVVLQYVAFVTTWGNQTMPKRWEDELVTTLGTTEHIAATLEIAHVIEPLGARLWSGFFDLTTRKIVEALKPRGLEKWQIGWADPARKGAGYGVRCILQPERKLQLWVGLLPSWGADKSLWGWPEYADLGVGFSERNATPDIPEIAQLRHSLNADGYLTNSYPDWWVARRTKVFPIGDSFMIDCIDDLGAISDRASSLVLELLVKYGPMIEVADRALGPIPVTY